MADWSRFASLEDIYILKIIDDKDTKATKNVIAGATRILHEYLQVKDGQFKTIEDIDTANIIDVSGTLRKFYAEFVYNEMILSPSIGGQSQYPYKKERTK